MVNTIPLFIADVHLGKLARGLRMLGFDTAYSNAYTNETLVAFALQKKRVLLSRNAALGKCHPSLITFVITHDAPEEQLKAVITRFRLLAHIQPFSRCMVCNGVLEAAAKETILDKLPEQTAVYYHEFWQCVHCKRIYWKGPHYKRMLQFIQRLQNQP